MAYLASASLARQIGVLFEGGCAVGLSDRQLLERFTARGEPADEAAFAAMVARHGPMVLGVCRQLLGDHHHAEDAFQAVFLVLARRARSIRDPDLLATWLYGVALRTARKARARLKRNRQTEEEGAVDRPEARPAVQADDLLDRELAEALHREIDRLPGAFRLPVLLCYFEGLTLDEAAHRLRWPAGTLRSRLARARDKLRRGLTRRGVVLPATALAALWEGRAASASVAPVLRDSTTRAALEFAAHHAAGGALAAPGMALARDVLRSMLLHKLKLVAMAVLFLGAVATGAGFPNRSPSMNDEPKIVPAATPPPAAIAAKPDAAAPGRMFVTGRVLDSQGKPVPNAAVMVYGASKQGGIVHSSSGPAALAQASCDASGRFRLEMPRISSATHHRIGAAALAPGCGLGWVDLDVDADSPAAEITLPPEQVIAGRLFDINGQAVQGVRVSVDGIGHPMSGPEALPDEIGDGPVFWGGNHARARPAWPTPALTGADGRFTIRGIGRDLRVSLMAEDRRFARQEIVVDTAGAAATKMITAAMEPAKIVVGRVTFADSGKPVPHAAVTVYAFRGGVNRPSEYETDADGNFRANPFSADWYSVNAHAPPGQPYLGAGVRNFGWAKGTCQRRVDLALPRAMLLRGKVVEEGSGLPVEGAALGYIFRDGNAGVPACRARTGPDGTYALAVLPQPGTLAVIGPSDDYVFLETGKRMLHEGKLGGDRHYAHAFVACDLKPGTEPRQVDIVIRRGVTVKARVTAPDGQPVARAWMFSRLLLLPQPWATRQFSGDFHGDVRNGHCELHGLAPDAEVPVYFLDAKNQLGAIARFSVKAAAGEPISVRLQPCGRARARLVDTKGRPLAGYREPFMISMDITPRGERPVGAADQDRLSSDGDFLLRIDPHNYNDLVADAQGRVNFPALIPGATHRIDDMSTDNEPSGRQARKQFVARTGETLELGDIVIAMPEP